MKVKDPAEREHLAQAQEEVEAEGVVAKGHSTM
jgi:hypothetical protein